MITLWHNRNSGTARCANTERPLTHSLDLDEEGLAMQATRTCSVDGCNQGGQLRRGWCNAHYRKWLKHGDPLADHRPVARTSCSVAGCEEPFLARDLCNKHYKRWAEHGDPTYTREFPNRWVGDAVGYDSAHDRVKSLHGPAANHMCRHCGDRAAHWAYDKTDPNESVDPRRGCVYSPDPARYMPLCVSCHWRFDGAAERLHAKRGGESDASS